MLMGINTSELIVVIIIKNISLFLRWPNSFNDKIWASVLFNVSYFGISHDVIYVAPLPLRQLKENRNDNLWIFVCIAGLPKWVGHFTALGRENAWGFPSVRPICSSTGHRSIRYSTFLFRRLFDLKKKKSKSFAKFRRFERLGPGKGGGAHSEVNGVEYSTSTDLGETGIGIHPPK